MRRLSLLAFLLGGCRYRLLPESRICEDLAYAVSERTYVCEEDAELAGARHAAFAEDTACLLPDEVEDPYNPEGILPAADNPTEQARIEALYDCIRAVRGAACADVAERGDDPGWWVGLHPSCAEIVSTGGTPPPSDTGDTGGAP